MKRWHWQALGVAALVWLVVTVVRAVIGVPGHIGLGGVFCAGAIVLVLGVVAVFMFRITGKMVVVIWQERWDWLMGPLRPHRPRRALEKTFHSGIDGAAHLIMLVIFELGIYWLALMSGYGILLGLWVMGSLAWNGNVALTTVQIG